MSKATALALFLCAALAAGQAAAAEQPLFKWVAANECYLLLSAAQNLRISGAGTASVKPWGIGFRAVGSQAFARTGGLQLQSVKVDKPGTGKDTFYLLDLLLGMQYLSPKTPGRPLRFSAAGYADLGLSDTTFYAAPVLSAGLLYTTSDTADTPTGLTFDIYYRLTDIELDNAGNNRAGTLKPALGFKVGYIFEGFWATAPRSGS